MKRIICFLAVCVLLAGSYASADSFLSVNGNFSGSLSGNIISLDLYEQDNQVITISTLFPEYAVSADKTCINAPLCFSFLSCFNIDTCTRIFSCFMHAADEWLKCQSFETHYGPYSGELFRYAPDMKCCEFYLKDFLSFLNETISSYTDNDVLSAQAVLFLSCLTGSIQDYYAEMNPVIQIRSFLDGHYTSILATSHSNDMFAVFAEGSAGNDMHLVLQYKKDGLHCFHDIRALSGNESLTFDVSFFTGKDASYQMNIRRKPLYHETLVLKEKKENEYPFIWTCDADRLNNPLIIDGYTKTYGEYAEIRAEACIQNLEKETLRITAYTGEIKNSVDLSDRKIIQADQEPGKTVIQLDAVSGIIAILTDVYPYLPAEYQTLLADIMKE